MPLQVGEQFDHYQVRLHLGRGGLGDVYAAQDVNTGRQIALKIPTRETIVDPRKYHQFVREVEVMSVLDHPAVQHGVDSGRWNNTPFLATDLVDGQSLRALLKENGPLSVDRAVALIRKLEDGLVYCHAQHVIHRDLKPENILVTEGDQPVILDFGLALTSKGKASTQAAGTPDYMAPEQVEGLPGDARGDIYALGTILYEMLAGYVPFASADLVDAMNRRLHEGVPRLDHVRPDIPASLATVVAKCLQRDPEKRYASDHELICDLDHLDLVDSSALEALSAAPPKPSFFKTELGQGLFTTAAFIAGIAILTLLLLLLKQ